MNKYSIIIPVYNVENTLERCLDSVINQTYKNLEIICVNDGSKDKSLEILKEYKRNDKRIIVIDKENGGVSSARNVGIEKCTGDIVTFLDSDDWYKPKCIEQINEIFEKNNEIDVCRNSYDLSNGVECKENTEKPLIKGKIKIDDINRSNILKQIYKGKIQSFPCLLFIKNSIAKKLKFDTEISIMEDVDFFSNLMYKINYIYFSDIIEMSYFYNINSATKSNKNFEKKAASANKLRKNLITLLKNNKNNKMLDLANSVYFKFTMELLFQYMLYTQNETEVKKYMKIFFANDKFDNFDKRELNTYYKLLLKSLKYNNYEMCIIIYKIKKYIKRLK